VQRLLRANQSEFPVVNEAGKLVGLLSRSDLVSNSISAAKMLVSPMQ
jgi:CBS domain-containing protein